MWKNKLLVRNALHTLGDVYTRIYKINYMTGKWHCIKEEDVYTAQHSNGKAGWEEFRISLLESVYPEYYEMYKNFTGLDNMRMVAQNQPEGEMYTYRKKFGDDETWVRALIIPMKGRRNKDCVLLCARDVEESVKAEEYRKSMMLESLRKAREADAAKADFLKYLAYDLNTPMNAVIKMCEMAEGYIRLGDFWAASYYMERVSNMASYTYSVINDVFRRGTLQEAHMEIKLESFSVRGMLLACKEYATALGVSDVTFEKDEDAALGEYYRGDELRLKQVLFSLLSNAFKFNRKGGNVRLWTYVEEQRDKEDRVVFRVEDTGCGIGGDFLPELYDLFAREPQSNPAPSKGVGFGLNYAKSVTEALGADIDVESKPGEGSCFTLSLWMERCEKKEEE